MGAQTVVAGRKTITDPQHALKLLNSTSGIVEALNKKGMRFEKRLDQILTIILDYLGVEQGSIMVHESKKLVVMAATRKDLIGMTQPLTGTSVASWVAKNKVPVFIPDIAKDERFPVRQGGSYKKNSLLSAPILQEKKLLGIINVNDKSGDKDLLQEDTTYLIEFGSFIISSLVNQKLQKELRRQKNTLRKRNQELRHQEKIRDELGRMLIHDLKAPLSEVVANLDILSYSISDENREFLEGAQMSCDRTVRMVSNLVTINKIEDGKMVLCKEEADLHSLLEESHSAIKGLAKIKGVTIRLDMPKEPLTTRLDRVLILRVLQNLLTNGLGHTENNTEITLGYRMVPKRKRVEFFVQDQGEGIPENKQKTIFEKYSRLTERQDALVGTGLGLYFCGLAVERHRGTIGISSSPGQGCRFFFNIPL